MLIAIYITCKAHVNLNSFIVTHPIFLHLHLIYLWVNNFLYTHLHVQTLTWPRIINFGHVKFV